MRTSFDCRTIMHIIHMFFEVTFRVEILSASTIVVTERFATEVEVYEFETMLLELRNKGAHSKYNKLPAIVFGIIEMIKYRS